MLELENKTKKQELKFTRNFLIGREHLTLNGKKTLCNVPVKSNYTRSIEHEKDINEITTCHCCLETKKKGKLTLCLY